MRFSEYIVFVDESGDHGLEKVNPNFPAFCLAFCIFQKTEYISKIIPALQSLKFRYWGHDAVVLHEHDLLKNMKGDYAIFSNEITRGNFINDITEYIKDASFQIIASVIRKDVLKKQYSQPYNPYDLAMLYCLERLYVWLLQKGQENSIIHVLCEGRGTNEDKALELAFLRICSNSYPNMSSSCDMSKIKFVLRFVDKKANQCGLQIADLVARPLALSITKPTQINRSYEVIRGKFAKFDATEHYAANAMTVFP